MLNTKSFFIFLILGIDIDSLIYDLSFGVRLPAPRFCPQPISYLLQKCFVTEPDQRPDFKVIKKFLEDVYRLLFTKTKLAEKQRNDQTVSHPMAIPSSTMKSRYVAVLQGNQVFEKPRDDRQQQSAKRQTKSEDISPVKYTTVQQLPKSSGNIEETSSDEQNIEGFMDDSEKNEINLKDMERNISPVQYATVEILSKSKIKNSSKDDGNCLNSENEKNTHHEEIKDATIFQSKDEEISSLSYKTLNSCSPKSLSDSTIYTNQYKQFLIPINKEIDKDSKKHLKDLIILSTKKHKNVQPGGSRERIQAIDTFPKQYQNGKLSSSLI